MLTSPHCVEKQALSAALLSLLLSLSLIAHAEPGDSQEPDEQETQPVLELVPPQEGVLSEDELPTLDGSITVEERIQLYRDLERYSRSIDSTHIVIENHRRGMRERLQERFSGADKDNDGSISREEATESLPQIARHFSQVDGNSDGVVTLNELAVVQAKMMARRQRSQMANSPPQQDANTASALESEVQEIDMIKRKSKELNTSQKKAL